MKNMINKVLNNIKNNYKEILINIIVISVMMFIALYNFPYLIYKPGGTIPLESRIYLDGKKITLGDYNLAYVSVSRGNLLNILASYIIKDWDLVKEETMVIPDSDYDTTLKVEKIDMQDSINTAKYVAYQKAGKEAEMELKKSYIYGILKEAQTDLQILDEIISVDGINYDNDINELNNYIEGLNVGDEVKLTVMNDKKMYSRYAKVINVEGRNLIGIYLHNVYDITVDPPMEIKSKESEAGASGGMMMTLAIYDALMEKDMTGGKKIVGTGTIEFDGTIGGIGGVKYKLLGAKKAKADIFFVPKENYDEAKKIYQEYKLKFALVSVETFDDVINYLNSI